VSLEEILKSCGFSKEEVLEWAKQNYPMFLSNESLIIKLFLIMHGIKLPVLGVGKAKKITELVEKEPCVINVVVVQMVNKIRYIGCPNCYSKLEKESECPKCGVVQGKEFFWRRYLVGDSSGEIILACPPSLSEKEIPEGTTINVFGSLRENGEFLARNITFVSQPQSVVEKVEEQKVEEIKEEMKKVEEKKEEIVEPKLEKDIEEKRIDEILIKYVKVGGMLRKKKEELYNLFKEKFPDKASPEIFDKALKLAGCKVEDGRVVLAL